jgi:hypothetical protein
MIRKVSFGSGIFFFKLSSTLGIVPAELNHTNKSSILYLYILSILQTVRWRGQPSCCLSVPSSVSSTPPQQNNFPLPPLYLYILSMMQTVRWWGQPSCCLSVQSSVSSTPPQQTNLPLPPLYLYLLSMVQTVRWWGQPSCCLSVPSSVSSTSPFFSRERQHRL